MIARSLDRIASRRFLTASPRDFGRRWEAGETSWKVAGQKCARLFVTWPSVAIGLELKATESSAEFHMEKKSFFPPSSSSENFRLSDDNDERDWP